MQTPNFGINLPQPGDMVFGKMLSDAMMEIDQKLFDALYRDNVLFGGAALAIADPGAGLSAPITLTPLPEAVFPVDVALKAARVIIPAGTNTVAAVGLEINFRKAGTLVNLLPAGSIPVPIGAALDTVVNFPAGVDVLKTEEIEAIVENVTVGAIVGAFDVSPLVLMADIKFTGE